MFPFDHHVVFSIYCKRLLYGGLGNLAEEGSEVMAIDISSRSMTRLHITSSSTCSNYVSDNWLQSVLSVVKSEGTPWCSGGISLRIWLFFGWSL